MNDKRPANIPKIFEFLRVHDIILYSEFLARSFRRSYLTPPIATGLEAICTGEAGRT